MAHIKFYLRNCSDPSMGVLNHWVLEGTKVLERKSYGVKLPVKLWDSKSGRLNRKHPDHIRINKMIENVISDFDYNQSIGGSGNIEEQCVLMLFQKLIDIKRKNGLSYGSVKKYETILRNCQEITAKIYGSEKLPIKYFREIQTVQSIKEELLKSRRAESAKTYRALKNYLGRLAEVINYWNATSGTQLPINTTPLLKFIGKDEQKLARTLTDEELDKFIDFQPGGKRGGYVERIAKIFFLFQYYCGGTRIHDVLLLTNKSFYGVIMEVRVRKNYSLLHNPITLELAGCLEPLYPEVFKTVFNESKMASIKLKLNTAMELAKLQHIDNISLWSLPKLFEVESRLKQKYPDEFKFIREYFDEAKEKLGQYVGERFFEELAKNNEHFLFPYLNFDDFKDTGLDFQKFSELKLEEKIQRARAKHNGALKRICKKIGIEPVSGHTPRHTVARHFVMVGADDNVIKDVLGHSNLTTTQHYLASRHPLRSREEELRNLYRQRRNRQSEQ